MGRPQERDRHLQGIRNAPAAISKRIVIWGRNCIIRVGEDMADIFFKCETCGNNLVSDDSGAGMTTHCPKCKAGTAVPKLVIIHQCPHCQQMLKFTGDMKGELIDCPSCKKEVLLPLQAGGEQKPLQPFICPKCNAELETFSAMADQNVVCPNCNERVRLRPKIRVKTGAETLSPVDASQQAGDDSIPPLPQKPKPQPPFKMPPILRYGVVDILLLILFLIPLPALNGHNFLYILMESVSGKQSHRSAAWNEGYGAGQNYGKTDKDAGLYDHRDPNFADRAKIAPNYAEGTSSSNDFWDGYRQGYAEKR